MFSRLNRWLQPLFLFLAALAIIWFLHSQWDTLAAQPWQIDGQWLALAVALLAVTWTLEVEIWRRLLLHLGGRLTLLQAIRIWFLSAVVRYVPGNVWQPLSLTLYCRRRGITPETTITSIALYQVILLLGTVPMAVGYLAWGGDGTVVAEFMAGVPAALYLLLLVPLGVFVLLPEWVFAVLNYLLVRLGRPPLQTRIDRLTLAGLVLATVVDWVLWGATFTAFTYGVAGGAAPHRLDVAALMVIVYPIAYTVGFLSLIAPSGFGVREGALALLLAPTLDGAVVAVVALGMRLFTMGGELLLALLSAPFERDRERPVSAPIPPAPSPVERAGDPGLRRPAS